MRVMTECFRRCVQNPVVPRQRPSRLLIKAGSISAYHPHEEGLVAIHRHLTNTHSDWLFSHDKIASLNFPFETSLHDSIVFLLVGRNSCQNSNKICSSKYLHQGPPQGHQPQPLPRLLYIQNPLVWVSNKLDFRYLRVHWDPFFTEAEFTRGARQAVSTVTQLVSMNSFDRMKPLFTKTGLLNLRRDVEVIWADEVRRNIGLAPEDVQLIIPRKLHFRQSREQKLLERGYSGAATAILTTTKPKSDKKFCDIDVLFIGLKYLNAPRFHQTPLCFVDIVARFHRDYTENVPPEWMISAFKVRRFNLIPQK